MHISLYEQSHMHTHTHARTHARTRTHAHMHARTHTHAPTPAYIDKPKCMCRFRVHSYMETRYTVYMNFLAFVVSCLSFKYDNPPLFLTFVYVRANDFTFSCFMGDRYLGCIMYVDDLALISVSALPKMISVCETEAECIDMTLNTSKYILIPTW